MGFGWFPSRAFSLRLSQRAFVLGKHHCCFMSIGGGTQFVLPSSDFSLDNRWALEIKRKVPQGGFHETAVRSDAQFLNAKRRAAKSDP
jgi:hypothetical protein